MDKICASATENNLAMAGRLVNNPELERRLTLRYIPTPCDELNQGLGGGIPISRITTVAGAPDSGKTGLMLETIAKNQKADPNFYVIWIETENSLDKLSIVNTYKVDPARFYFQLQTRSAAAEGIGDLIETCVGSDASPDMVVINSLKMLVPKTEMGKSMTKVSVAEQARFNSNLMKKLVTLFSENECALVLIQDLSTNIGQMFGDPLQVCGGQSIRYNSSIMLDLRKLSIQETDPIKRDEGLKIKASIKKNHCITDRFPYVSVEYFVEFGKGIEKNIALLHKLIDNNLLISKGAWIRRFDADGIEMPDYVWNGKTAFKRDMDAHPEKFAELKELVANSMIERLSEKEIEAIENLAVADEVAVLENEGQLSA